MLDCSKEINVDITYRCTLQCKGCNRQDEEYTIVKQEMCMDEFLKVLDEYDTIMFCGGQSDPIFHTQFIDFLKICYERNKLAIVHTAASHKKKQWYEEAFYANPKARWKFGIDGLPKDSHKYRVNQDGQKLFDMMLMAHQKGLDVEWQYIVFDYNEDTQLDAYKLARDTGIRLQLLETNSGVDGNNINLNYNLSNEVVPRCLNKTTPMYYAAGGHILPCCWLDSHKDEVKELYDPTLTLTKNSIQDIVNSDIWKKFNHKIKSNPYEICRKRCGINYNEQDAKLKITFLNVN